jgi:hypothetical protein
MKELVALENSLNVPLLARKCMNALQFRGAEEISWRTSWKSTMGSVNSLHLGGRSVNIKEVKEMHFPAELNGLAVVIDPESNFIIRVVDRCPSTTAGRRTAKAHFCDVTLQAEQQLWT